MQKSSFWTGWFKPVDARTNRKWTIEELRQLYDVLLKNGAACATAPQAAVVREGACANGYEAAPSAAVQLQPTLLYAANSSRAEVVTESNRAVVVETIRSIAGGAREGVCQLGRASG